MSWFFYWSGVCLWIVICCVVAVLTIVAASDVWRRVVCPSIMNLWFAIAAPKYWPKMTYYDKWRQLYEKPGLRKFWKKRHNHYSRVAYKRLVREAWKESKKQKIKN